MDRFESAVLSAAVGYNSAGIRVNGGKVASGTAVVNSDTFSAAADVGEEDVNFVSGKKRGKADGVDGVGVEGGHFRALLDGIFQNVGAYFEKVVENCFEIFASYFYKAGVFAIGAALWFGEEGGFVLTELFEGWEIALRFDDDHIPTESVLVDFVGLEFIVKFLAVDDVVDDGAESEAVEVGIESESLFLGFFIEAIGSILPRLITVKGVPLEDVLFGLVKVLDPARVN